MKNVVELAGVYAMFVVVRAKPNVRPRAWNDAASLSTAYAVPQIQVGDAVYLRPAVSLNVPGGTYQVTRNDLVRLFRLPTWLTILDVISYLLTSRC